ncbi:MAG: urease accessory protein UreD [Alphaproteobacteria bacterium]
MNQPLPGASLTRTTQRAGRVDLGLRRAPDGRSFIARQHATYPFHLCRPHHVGGDPAGMATLYLQSAAGGVFEHDRLAVDVTVEERAALHLTSQSSTIVHSMTGGTARLSLSVTAGTDALVEVLPEATILFPGARLETTTRISADETAIVCLGEGLIGHDPQGGDAMFERVLSTVIFETRDGRVLVEDRQAIDGTAFRALSGRQGPRATYGGLYLWAPRSDLDALAARVEQRIATLQDTYAGVSLLPEACGLAVRIIAADGLALRAGWIAIWQVLRLGLCGATPTPRRK